MTDLRPGMPAPDFTLPLATFGSVSLSNMRGKPVVLYFYPKDDTPGCTTEACDFMKAIPAFGNFDAAVIGISKDSVESHAAFAKKYGIKFHLASDEQSNTCETYGVWVQKNNYGTKYMGIERTTFLIDRHGTIRHIWPRVKVEGHAEEVLKFVECLHMGQLLPGETPPPPPEPPKPLKAAKPAKVVAAKPVKAEPVKAAPAKAEPVKAAKASKPVPAKAAAKAAAKAPAKAAAKPVAKKASAKPAAKKPVAKKAAAKPVAKKPVKKVAKPAAKKPAPKAAPKAAKKVAKKKI